MQASRRFVLLIAVVVVVANAHAWDFDDEVYMCTTCGMSFPEMQSAGITLVSHVTYTREWMEQAARYGIRGLPYISLYKVYDATAEGADKAHPFWNAVDIAEHPEWVYIGADGKRQRPFGNEFYPKQWWQSCTNTAGMADAYVEGVQGVLDCGAGGVFVDNVLPAVTCYGPKFGIHEHLYPDKDNIYSFKVALGRVGEALKARGPKTAMVINVGGWEPWVGFGDCMMLESFIYNVDVRPGPGGWVGDEIVRVKQWPQILAALDAISGYVDSGGNAVTLEYLPEDPEPAFYTYACAKLGNLHWAPFGRTCGDVARRLYRCHMQSASGPMLEQEGVYYRHYPEGLVAVNPTDADVSIRLPAPPGCEDLVDVLTASRVDARSGAMRARIPADAGRVYMRPTPFATGCLRESDVALRAALERSCRPDGQREPTLSAAHDAATEALDAVDRGAPDAPAVIAELLRCLDAARPGDDTGVGAQLASGPDITPAEAMSLLDASSNAPETVASEVGEDAVTLGNASGQWQLCGRDGTIANGPLGLNTGVSVASLHAEHGWLNPGPITRVETLEDGPARKSVRITAPLVGSKTQQVIHGLELVVTAEVRAADPALHVSAAVRNAGDEALPVYANWVTQGAGAYRSMRGAAAVTADDYVQFGSTGWTYVSPTSTGGQGLLLVTDHPQSVSRWGVHMYSEPRSGPLAPGQERCFSFAVAVVADSWAASPDSRAAFVRAWVNASDAWRALVGQQACLRLRGVPVAGGAAVVEATGRDAAIVATFVTDACGEETSDAHAEVAGARATISLQPAMQPSQMRLGAVYRVSSAHGAVPVLEQAFVNARPSVSLASGTARWSGHEGEAGVVITNLTGSPVECELTVAAPDGYAGPEPRVLQLAARQTRTLPVRIHSQTPCPAPVGVFAHLGFPQAPDGGAQSVPLEFLPHLRCPRALAAPAIDGALDDAMWANAAATAPFGLIADSSPPREPTRAMVAHDDAYLYVAFRCNDSQMDKVVANTQPGPESNRAVHGDDSVEFFLQPGGDQPYIQFAANSLGAWRTSTPAKWDVAARRGTDEWTVEMRIDIASIAAEAKGAWRVNFCRMQQRMHEASAWSPTGKGFHVPERFGILSFED